MRRKSLKSKISSYTLTTLLISNQVLGAATMVVQAEELPETVSTTLVTEAIEPEITVEEPVTIDEPEIIEETQVVEEESVPVTDDPTTEKLTTEVEEPITTSITPPTSTSSEVEINEKTKVSPRIIANFEVASDAEKSVLDHGGFSNNYFNATYFTFIHIGVYNKSYGYKLEGENEIIYSNSVNLSAGEYEQLYDIYGYYRDDPANSRNDNGVVRVRNQQAHSKVNIDGVINDPATVVKDPQSINVGRDSDDTFGDNADGGSWTISGPNGYTLTGPFETQPDMSIINNLEPGIYTISNTVYESIPADFGGGTVTDTTSGSFEIVGGTVITNHIYTDSNGEVVPASTQTGKQDQDYTTQPLSENEIPKGYKLATKVEGEVSGKFEKDVEKVVTYYYEPVDSDLIVTHKTADGEVLAPQESQTGKYNQVYTTQAAEIEGYELVATPGNATGKFDVETTQVDYVYAPKPTQVIVHHVDKDGNTLATDTTVEGKFKEEYTTTAETIKGYTLVEVPSNSEGTLSMNTPDVTYVYEKVKSNLVTEFVDEDGNTLSPTLTTTGEYLDEYATTPAEIPGYELIEMPVNATGEYSDVETKVTYVYKRKETQVTVKHLDVEGNELVATSTETGLFEDPYTSEQANITGYIFKEMDLASAPATGEFGDKDQTVIYVYEKIKTTVTTNFVDEEGNPIPGINPEVVNGEYADPYVTTPAEIPGYELVPDLTNGDPVTGDHDETDKVINYVYKKAPADLVVYHQDKDGNELAPSSTQEGLYQDEYKTEPVEIPGYVLVTTPINATGKYDVETTNVTYVYEKIKTTVTTNFVDEEGNPIPGVNPEVVNGEYADPYVTTPQEIPGYELVPELTNGDSVTGEHGETDKVINYVYKKIVTVVDVHHVDKNGNVLAPSTSENGTYQQAYDTASASIYGYTLIAKPVNAAGQHDLEPTNVTYVYELIKPTVNQAKEGDTTVTGTGVPGFQVEVTFPNGETVIVDVDQDGNWEAPVPTGVYLKKGDQIGAVTIDPAYGTKSTRSDQALAPVIAESTPDQEAPNKPAGSKTEDKSKKQSKVKLPQTGETTLNTTSTIFGWSIVAAIGLFLNRRKRKSID